MYAPQTFARRPSARRGAILLVVMTLLALFAVVGLSFALYAEAEAVASRIHRESITDDSPFDTNPTYAEPFVNEFLNQLIYDVGDIGQPTTSALRGHGLARLMYGQNPNGPNDTPYNGVGTFYEDLGTLGFTGPGDRREVVNFSYSPTGIVDPEHTGFRPANAVNNPAWFVGRTYIGKNDQYSYPDRNNMAIGMINPATGEVVLPSFHRHNVFNVATTNVSRRLAPPTPTGVTGVGFPSGEATNQDWITPAGRYRILRPRPIDHVYNDGSGNRTEFPYPPPNPDGSFTGDVQNWRWTNGVQRNDSMWLNANMPVFTYRNKRITALVAPLVVPLDGRINALVAGNIKGSNSGMPNASHASNQGFGPYEMNPAYVMSPGANQVVEGQRLAAWRYGNNAAELGGQVTPGQPNSTYPMVPVMPPYRMPPQRGTTPQQTNAVIAGAPANIVSPYDYARVDWDGGGDGSQLALPTGTQSDPQWPTGQYGNSDAAVEATFHPALFNPYTWFGNNGTGAGRTFPLEAAIPLLRRYSDSRGAFAKNPLLDIAPDSLVGTWNNAPTSEWVTGPNDRSAPVRSRLTWISNSLRKPGLMPGFAEFGGAGGYAMNPPMMPGEPHPAPTDPQAGARQLTVPPTLGAVSDYPNAETLRSALARLGTVDLNRPLADYRGPTNPTGPIDPNTINTHYFAAWQDRQALAQDIFNRLIVVTGAAVQYPFNPTTRSFSQGFTPDGSTGIFDGIKGSNPTQYNAVRWLAQLSANIVDYIDNDDINTPFIWNPTDPANAVATSLQVTAPITLGDRSVFGVEKPRLLLNEAYSEIANDPMDAARGMGPAMEPFRIRFWVELLNPGNTLTNDTVNPIGNGQVRLFDPNVAGGTSVYRLQIYGPGMAGPMRVTQIAETLADPGNVTGQVHGDVIMPDPNDRDVDFGFLSTMPGLEVVAPVDTDGNGVPAATPGKGFAVVGPQTTEMDGPSFRPDQTPPFPPQQVLAVPDMNMPPNKMEYTVMPTDAANLPVQQHVVVLRRLACPYLPANDPLDGAYNPAQPPNPYITVDYMSSVVSHPALRYVAGDNNPFMLPMPSDRKAIGRRQPFAATMALPPTPHEQTTPDPNFPGVSHSFWQHSDVMTRDQVFEWLVHLDRPLVNAMELQHVPAVAPHELTHRFVSPTPPLPPPGTPIPATNKHQHAARWQDPATHLHRALELLAVRPWIHDVAEGGRTPGRVNINMIWDQTVLQAMLDPQAANGFDVNAVNTLWSSLIAGGPTARTANFPMVSPTVAENPTFVDPNSNTGPDRPIRGLGTAEFAAGGILPTGRSIQDTILRTADGTPNTPPVIMLPQMPGTREHPYQLDEMLRKMSNNFTTVSDTYLVLMTVGFFEVRAEIQDPLTGVTRVVLGKEIGRDVPGDLRVQYAAVVDRTQLSMAALLNYQPATGIAAGSPVSIFIKADGRDNNEVYGEETNLDGTFVWSLRPNNWLLIGDGAHAEYVRVSGVSFDGTGTATIQFNATRNHPPFTPIRIAYQGEMPWYATVAQRAEANSQTIRIFAHQSTTDVNGQPAVAVVYEGKTINISRGSRLRIGNGDSAEWVVVDPRLAQPAPTFDPVTGIAELRILTNPSNLSQGLRYTHHANEVVTNTATGNPGPQSSTSGHPDARKTFNPRDPAYRGVIPYVGRVPANP